MGNALAEAWQAYVAEAVDAFQYPELAEIRAQRQLLEQTSDWSLILDAFWTVIVTIMLAVTSPLWWPVVWGKRKLAARIRAKRLARLAEQEAALTKGGA